VNDYLKKAFRKELHCMAALQHKSITFTVQGLILVNSWHRGTSASAVLVDEYETLGPYLTSKYKENPPSWNEIFAYAAKMADCLRIMHSEGIIHNQPGLLAFCVFHNEVKIRNFSESCLGPPYKVKSITHLSAPECRVDGTCSPKTDMYTFGISLWQLAQASFGNSFKLEPQATWLLDPTWPEVFRDMISSCMSQNPATRPDVSNLFSQLKLLKDNFKS